MPDIAIHHRQSHFALDVEFSLDAPWTVIFGPSGAGKTTLLRIVAGLVTPESGRIAVGGTTVLDTAKRLAIPPGKRSIGFVTQQAALFPHLTAGENIAFGIRHWKGDARQARMREMLRLFDAESLAERRPARLSGGERQRIALARALAPNPGLLLLDEPLAALDDASGQDILSRLLALPTRVIYVSHDLAEIWPLPAHVLLLERGRVTATGPLQRVLAPQRDRLLRQLSS